MLSNNFLVSWNWKTLSIKTSVESAKKDKNTVENFGETFIDLINNIQYCSQCYCISESNFVMSAQITRDKLKLYV